MRIIILAAALAVAVPAVAEDRGYDIAMMRAFEAVADKTNVRPTRNAFALFECATTAAKGIALRSMRVDEATLKTDAADAMAACQGELVAVAIEQINNPADVRALVLRGSGLVIRIARSPRPVECANPADAHCMRLFMMQ